MLNHLQKRFKKTSKEVKAIVFDFDGVLVDSLEFKREAYFKLFPTKYSQVVTKTLKEMDGRIRSEIISTILIKTGLPKKDLKDKLDKYIKKYNYLVEEQIIKKGLIEGVKKTLKDLSKTGNIYLNSSTPQDSLERCINGLKIRNLFKEIYGKTNNRGKKDNLSRILENSNYSLNEVVVVGDSIDDFLIAKELSCLFIGISNQFSKWEEISFPILNNISKIQSFLKNPDGD